MLLSIIIPVYNEAPSIKILLERIDRVMLPPGVAREVIVIDDCSTDPSWELMARHGTALTILRNDRNRGKGYCVRRGLAAARGDIAVIQDGDLEYDPDDYVKLLAPILSGGADVAYGSRFLKREGQQWLHGAHRMANRLLTALSNLLTGLRLTDMETCYKMLSRPVIDAVLPLLTANRYTIEPEITIAIARAGYTIVEVPVSYRSRTHKSGKKIGFLDGLAAVAAMLYFSLRKSGRQTS